MQEKIIVIAALILSVTFSYGQSSNKDSLKRQFDSIKWQVDSLNQLLTGCTGFQIHRNPKWVDNIKTSKTYIKNCFLGSTYIALNADSTYLFKHNGEGLHFLQKGKWVIANDSILILRGVKAFSQIFKLKMKRLEKVDYFIKDIFLKEYLMKQDMLIERLDKL